MIHSNLTHLLETNEEDMTSCKHTVNIRKPECGRRKYYVRPHEITSQENIIYMKRKTKSVPECTGFPRTLIEAIPICLGTIEIRQYPSNTTYLFINYY
jgi:hypothetical protein